MLGARTRSPQHGYIGLVDKQMRESVDEVGTRLARRERHAQRVVRDDRSVRAPVHLHQLSGYESVIRHNMLVKPKADKGK